MRMTSLLQGDRVTTPDSDKAFSKTSVHGVDSFGMLCSAHDMDTYLPDKLS